jgi:O-antigen/teichoic acid export membrane protein
MDSLGRLAGNIVHFLASNVVTFVLGMAASVVMARSLGPNDLGIFHQVSWFAGMVSVAISLGLVTSITKFTAQFKAEGRSGDILSAVRFIFYVEVAIAAVATAALLLLAPRIADHYFSPDQTRVFTLAFLAITPGMQTAIFSAVLEGAQVFRYQTLHAVTVTPAALLTKVWLMLNGYGLESLFWSNLAFAAVNLAFYFWAARREGLLRGWFRRGGAAERDGKSWKRELIAYNRSIVPIHFVDILVWSRTENYFLGRYCPASQIAYYNLAHNLITRFTGILPSLMWKILLPLTAEQHGKAQEEKMRRTYTHALRYSALIAFPTVTVCFLAAYELIVIFYGKAYAEAEVCFQILCVSALLSSLAQPGSAVMYASNRQGFILAYGSVLAALNIGLCYLIIPEYGARGAAACYAVSSILGVGGGFAYTTRKMGLVIPWSAWAKTAAASLAMGLALYVLLRTESPWYGLFAPVQDLLRGWTGRDFDMLLGTRAVRLMSACALSGLLYLAVVLYLFTPGPDDRLILAALRRFLPGPLNWVIARKLGASAEAGP